MTLNLILTVKQAVANCTIALDNDKCTKSEFIKLLFSKKKYYCSMSVNNFHVHLFHIVGEDYDYCNFYFKSFPTEVVI